MKTTHILRAATGVLALTGAANAEMLSITVENTLGSGGFALTPVWFGLSDGSFETFTPGLATTAPGITEIAELGDTQPITDRFNMQQPNGTQLTFASAADGPPVFSPGENATATVDVTNPGTYRFLNFASMVVPTNDLFVGNSTGIEVFDAMGNFNGPITIDLFGADVWDNGSEVNDINDGPAFVQGVDATGGTNENGVARLLFGGDAQDDQDAIDYLQSIVGITTVPGDTITSAFDEGTRLGRITIVPTPNAAALFGVFGAAALRRRR
jgi:hypothetical protein